MVFVKRFFCTLAGVFLLHVSLANAAIVIDFGTGLLGSGGTITESSGDVTGEGILIGSLTTEGTTNNGTFVVDAILTFDTANNTVSIIGNIADFNIVNETLLSGSFDSFSFIPGTTSAFFGSGPDLKGEKLLIALGIVANTPFEFFGFSLQSKNGTVVSTDFVNTAVPVPAAVWLFGSGLLGLAGVARRRKV